MQKYEFQIPNEVNHYNLFPDELENDPLVFFHITPSENFDSIIKRGFLFASTLGKEEPICFYPLMSVSYAKNSSSCLTHRGENSAHDNVIFVVKFETLNLSDIEGITINPSDIHVRNEAIQPQILGYCIVPQAYIHS